MIKSNGLNAVAGAIAHLAIFSFAAASNVSADDGGFTAIFDGKTLTGWEGDPDLWRVEDGAITGQTTPDKPIKVNTFLIWKQGEVDDFELTCDYRMFGGNSGIQYRSFMASDPDAGKWTVGGYQADMDAANAYTGILYGERYRGILSLRGQKTVIGDDHKPKLTGQIGDAGELRKKIKSEDWNTYRIVARGYHFTHEINGQLMSDVTDEDKADRRRAGIIAFQLHVGKPMKVQFRNIQLKRLPMKDAKKIVMVAGPDSHGYMAHAHYAGLRLLADDLNACGQGVYAAVYRNGWPADPTAFDNADAIVMYCDGGEGHMVNPHLKEVDALAKKGVGIACLHYGVEVPKGEPGKRFLDWIGGYFETWWSVNPTWTAEFKGLPQHPITRGVRPFTIRDEWYYHMRFRKEMQDVTPILSAVAPGETLSRPDGPHEGNKDIRADVAAGHPQHLAWACVRPGGGRGFGFTGGHDHFNWGCDDFRKLVLNAIVWVAKGEIPEEGIPSKTPTIEELKKNQSSPVPANYDFERISREIEKWNRRSAPAS